MKNWIKKYHTSEAMGLQFLKKVNAVYTNNSRGFYIIDRFKNAAFIRGCPPFERMR